MAERPELDSEWKCKARNAVHAAGEHGEAAEQLPCMEQSGEGGGGALQSCRAACEFVMKECVTHHHACDCREAEFAGYMRDALRYRELRDHSQQLIVCDEHGSWYGDELDKKLDEERAIRESYNEPSDEDIAAIDNAIAAMEK